MHSRRIRPSVIIRMMNLSGHHPVILYSPHLTSRLASLCLDSLTVQPPISSILMSSPTAPSSINWSTPLQVGRHTLQNRVLFAPCTRNRGNVPGKLQAEYYKQRAGAGLIISEGTLPSAQGYEYANAPGIYNKKQVAGWKLVTNAVHSVDGVMFCQLMHIGRVANPLFQAGQPAIGPSAVAAQGGKFKQQPYKWVDTTGGIHEISSSYVTPEAIDDIPSLLDEYRHAFKNIDAAGFDGVELHGGNGYLLSQFLDSKANVREDKYGGSPENRCRFILEVMDIAIEVLGAERVAIKLTPEGGFNDVGMPMPELLATYGYLLKEISKRSIAFVDIQRWFSVFDPSKRGTIVDTREWRKLYPTGRLFLNAQMTPTEALSLIQDGSADAILFGRWFCSTPDLAERIQKDLPVNPFDWATAFAPGTAGYTDYKTWAELGESERENVTTQWKEHLKYLEDDRQKTIQMRKEQDKETAN